MFDVSVANNGIFQATAAWSIRLKRWWLAGLRQALPRHLLTWADAPVVLIQRDGEEIVCEIASSSTPATARFRAGYFDGRTLFSWLAEHGFSRDQVIVQPLVPSALFFLRQTNVPKSALHALPKILEQELPRRTPFQLSDVWHEGGVTHELEGGIAVVSHWIIRRDRATTGLSELGLTVDDVDCLAVAGTSDEAAPRRVITFRVKGNEDPAWALRAIRVLALAAIAATLLSLLLFEWCQANVAAALDEKLMEVRQAVQGGRGEIDPAARLIAMKADVGILDALDELSRILPDHTFLTEARVAQGKATISGFSSDAARLIRSIDQSSMFSGAALASAITPDTSEHKERFTITFQIRGAQMLKVPVVRSDRS